MDSYSVLALFGIRLFAYLVWVYFPVWLFFVAGEAKISIFPRVFEVFRLVRDVFPVCLVRGARRFEKTPIFRKLTKTHRKIAISSRLLPFFDGGSAPDR